MNNLVIYLENHFQRSIREKFDKAKLRTLNLMAKLKTKIGMKFLSIVVSIALSWHYCRLMLSAFFTELKYVLGHHINV